MFLLFFSSSFFRQVIYYQVVCFWSKFGIFLLQKVFRKSGNRQKTDLRVDSAKRRLAEDVKKETSWERMDTVPWIILTHHKLSPSPAFPPSYLSFLFLSVTLSHSGFIWKLHAWEVWVIFPPDCQIFIWRQLSRLANAASPELTQHPTISLCSREEWHLKEIWS